MPEQSKTTKNKFSTDWLLRGVLTKIGDTFDRLTGRSYKPSSSLATSELIEKLKKMLDFEVKDGKFVPHNIKIKMQWDKFSTDADDALKKLESEIKIALIDHINDHRYHTYAPIKLEIKPDYFTEGVKLLVSFDKFVEEEREVAVNVTVPQIKVADFVPSVLPEIQMVEDTELFIAHYQIAGKPKTTELLFKDNQRLSVGRSKDNDLSLEDQSVSKIHAAIVMNAEKHLAIADTGSTNGTFINDKRMAYGKAVQVSDTDRVKFGNIEVKFEFVPKVREATLPALEVENFVPPESAPVSQNTVKTIAFNSKEDLDLKAKSPTPTVHHIEVIKKIEPPKVPEPVPSVAEQKSDGTEERIVLDFSKND